MSLEIHTLMQNSNDDDPVFEGLEEQNMRPDRKLPIASPDVVAGSPSSRIVRNSLCGALDIA
jgi:hypothetical protein